MFFKVPVDKLAAKLHDPRHRESVVFNRSQLALLKGLEDFRFWVHISARRTGKSYAAAILALAKLLEPGQQVIVVAPNYNLSSIIWDYVVDFITQLQIETDKKNDKDKIVKLVNGSVFRLLSANHRDSLVGRAANLLIVDEAAIIENDEYFVRDLRPALSTFDDSRALFIGTPRGRENYLYKYYLRGQDEIEKEKYHNEWGSDLFDWTANPGLSISDIEEAKRSMPYNMFRQEYYCEWATFEGQIYALTDEDHLKDLKDIHSQNRKYDFIAGLDMGYRDDTAFVVVATDGENYNIVDNFSYKKSLTSTVADDIKLKIENWGIEHIFIDAAAAQAKADLAYDYDIYCEGAIKSVNDGIAHIQNLVEKKKIFFDITNARASYAAMCAYRWNNGTEMQKPKHDPNSHYADAIRYAIYSFEKTKLSITTERS